MYYLKISATILFALAHFALLIYSLLIPVRVIKRRIEIRDAVRKAFWAMFSACVSIFIIGLIWLDTTNWDSSSWIEIIVITFGMAVIVSFIVSVAYSRW